MKVNTLALRLLIVTVCSGIGTVCAASVAVPGATGKQVDMAKIFDLSARLSRIPTTLLRAVCWVESNHRTVKTKSDGVDGRNSYGICQLKLQTARDMGFTGTAKELMQPHWNIYYAAQYLGYQLRRYHGNVKKAVKAYNRGHCSGSVNCQYVRKVMKAYKEGR